ncbi:MULTISPECIES: energy-coupling factor transporter transmembrane protein EcfT [Bacillus cereus group]|nr:MULTISPECIES: energy-coupling factor transporter transmembrane protein EcfT [Bacillus cereus group]MEC0096559.1 energy-coupling factor transporter transmembrane protein EcfT [Bacillus anthracis]
MDEWIASQKETTHHKIAIILFPITLFLGYIHPGLFGFGLFLFFIITSFKLLKKMLFFMIILGLISVILPFLAPIIFIVMLVLFFMRIQFVIKNWRPFLAGLLIYGIAAILLTRMSFDPTSTLVYDSSFSKLMESIIVSALGFIGIRTTLIWLYGHNYSSYTALGIMGSVPLIIISFILPFLKMHMGGDVYVAEPGVVDGHAVTGETVVHSSDAHITKGANLQHVQPHVRTAPDGDITNNLSYHGPDAKPVNPDTVAVKGYVRTAPDGDVTNNLSYHGPDAKPVNPDTVAVKGYVRTAPDGDVTNNLSHHGPDAKTVNVETQGNDYVKTSLDGDTATSKGSSQWDDMTPEQKETVMTAFNGVAVGQGMVDKILKGVEREKGRNGFCGHCGKERSGKGRFCVSCGGSLEYDEQTPKQTNDRKRGNFIVVGIIGVIVVAGALFMAKSSLITNDEKVETSTEFSEGMETKKLSTAALSDIDGYWVDKGIPSYVGIKITGDKRGEITFYSGEENTTYLFKLQNSEEKKMSLRIYEEKSNVASFVPFNARVNIVDDQQIELIRLGQEEDNLSLTRMTKDEFMNYYEPVDEKKAYTGKNEQFKNAKTKIPFVQIESSWINTSGGPNISFILAEGERSGELIIEQGQPGGGRLPQHKFYISSEPKDGDNTYIISLQQTSGEYRDVELTLTEDQLRMKMDGEESFYRKG